MGTQDRRLEQAGTLALLESERRRLQADIDSCKIVESRRKLGQFVTPYELAREIVAYGLELHPEHDVSFLEPAVGTGAFYSALLAEADLHQKHIKKAIGVELDRAFYAAARELWDGTGIELINADFTEVLPAEKVDLLVANPPYVRHHYIPKARKARLATSTKNEVGITLSGLAGLYCYFILCSHKWLAPNAVCGWLIPSEFMDVNYGKELKAYLLDKVQLLRIHRYTPETCKFDDALVSSCVVWFSNRTTKDNYNVEFSYGGTHASPDKRSYVSRSVLKESTKWTHFPNAGSLNYSKQTLDTSHTIGDFFVIKRGLVTGDNDFFVIPEHKIDELNIDTDFLTPILPSPRYLKCDEVLGDENGYPCLEPRYFLLDCTLSEDEVRAQYPATWNYLSSGEATTGQKYLCKHRRVWYHQEKRDSAPFLCSYMGRSSSAHKSPFRFILNHTSAVAANSYLMLYPKPVLKEAISRIPNALNAVWDALRTITADDIRSEGRIYGGGLNKIEPKELAHVKCPALSRLVAG